MKFSFFWLIAAGCGAPPALVGIDIDSDAVDPVAVGGVVQLSVVARYDDGESVDVSADADWTSSDETIASVEGGLVTGLATGVATIGAGFDGEEASMAVEVVDLGPFVATVSGDWSRQHGGQGLTFYARVVDDQDGLVVACGSEVAKSAEWSLVSVAGVLEVGRTYHGEAYADVNGDGLPNDPGHMYIGDSGEVVAGAQSFEVKHSGAEPEWSVESCRGEIPLQP